MSDPRPSSEQPPTPGPRLRGPRGCMEWTVVVMGLVYVLLLILFVVVLVIR